jgi:hypothetical protein
LTGGQAYDSVTKRLYFATTDMETQNGFLHLNIAYYDLSADTVNPSAVLLDIPEYYEVNYSPKDKDGDLFDYGGDDNVDTYTRMALRCKYDDMNPTAMAIDNSGSKTYLYLGAFCKFFPDEGVSTYEGNGDFSMEPCLLKFVINGSSATLEGFVAASGSWFSSEGVYQNNGFDRFYTDGATKYDTYMSTNLLALDSMLYVMLQNEVWLDAGGPNMENVSYSGLLALPLDSAAEADWDMTGILPDIKGAVWSPTVTSIDIDDKEDFPDQFLCFSGWDRDNLYILTFDNTSSYVYYYDRDNLKAGATKVPGSENANIYWFGWGDMG